MNNNNNNDINDILHFSRYSKTLHAGNKKIQVSNFLTKTVILQCFANELLSPPGNLFDLPVDSGVSHKPFEDLRTFHLLFEN